jgi:hypothetical protein
MNLAESWVNDVVKFLEDCGFVAVPAHTMRYRVGMDGGRRFNVNRHLQNAYEQRIKEKF